MCLLVGAGLLVRSFARLQARSLGFRTDNVLTGLLILPPNRYAGLEQNVSFLEALVERLRAWPGVEAVGLVNTLPLTGMNARRPFQAPGIADRDQGLADVSCSLERSIATTGKRVARIDRASRGVSMRAMIPVPPHCSILGRACSKSPGVT